MAIDKSERKRIIDEYRQQKVYMGVYQLRNAKNGRAFIESASNLKSRELTLRMMLDDGRHPNRLLQQDWDECGSEAFEYSVLEEVEAKPDATPHEKARALEAMKALWLSRQGPAQPPAYNKGRH